MFADVSTAYTIELATDANGDILFGSDGNPGTEGDAHHANGRCGRATAPISCTISSGSSSPTLTFDTGLFTGAPVADLAAQGALTIDNAAPAVGNTLTAASTINDFEGVTR